MTDEKKLKDAIGLWALIAVLAVLIIPFIHALMGQATSEMQRYRDEGRVGQGVVTGLRAVEESYTGRRGRPRTRTNHFIDIDYDLYPTTPYADYIRAGEILPPGGRSNGQSSHSLSSNSYEVEAHRVGQSVAVVVIPDDPFEPMLFTTIRDYSNWPNYLLMLVALLGATFCGWRAWINWQQLRALRGGMMQPSRPAGQVQP